jgi:hypothetical protein
MSAKVTIHSCGSGVCSLSGKEGEGMTVTFEDGTLREGFLSHRAFQQLIKMKVAQVPKAQPAVPQAVPAGNGPPAVK